MIKYLGGTMEFEILPCRLKEVICFKRTKLNELIKEGINEELIELSQELDLLINYYSKAQIEQ